MSGDFSKYFKQELLITFVTVAASQLIYKWTGAPHIATFYWVTASLFFLCNMTVLIYAYRIHQSPNLQQFNSTITVSFLFKLILTGVLIYSWKEKSTQEIPYLAIHYFLLYVIYTVHEVYYLVKLAQKRPKS